MARIRTVRRVFPLINLILVAALVGVGIFQAVIYWRQANIMDTQAGIADKQWIAMKEQLGEMKAASQDTKDAIVGIRQLADATIKSLRAWVAYEDPPVPVTPLFISKTGARFDMRFHIRNVGKSVASSVKLIAELRILADYQSWRKNNSICDRARAERVEIVQIVAFPQSGVMRCPGVLDLLDAAVRNAADLVGGIDPLEIDRDPKGQLDGIFAIAARHDVGLDIHLHEPGEMGLFNVQEICARTKALGLGGKVTISHGLCLGGITERKAAEATETMAEAGVALVTHGAGGLTMPPIEMLRAAGVLVFAGNDDIRDTWSPYGTGDLLERAAMIGRKGDFRRDGQVEVAFDLVSAAGARALGIGNYGIAVGGAANLFTIAASCVAEAVASSVAQAGAFRRQDGRPRRRVSGCTDTRRERRHDLNRSQRSALPRWSAGAWLVGIADPFLPPAVALKYVREPAPLPRKSGFATDSSLEEAGFEPLVPP
jgi:Amidohydrolase family